MHPTDGPAPHWLRNAAIAAVIGLAVGLVVLAVVAPLAYDKPDAAAATPSPSGGLISIQLPGVPPLSPSPTGSRLLPSRSGGSIPATGSPAPAMSRRSSGMTARYVLGDTWDGGYEASISIATMVPVTGWSAVLTLPAGIQVTTSWEAEFHQEGRVLTLTPKPWNDAISRGQSVTIGFQVSGGNGQPSTCSVNGVKCTK